METNSQRFEADTTAQGIDVYSRELDSRLHLTENCENLSNYRSEGVGVRYGMAPLPAHATIEAIDGVLSSLRTSESTTQIYKNRKKIFGIFPITLGTYDDIKEKKNHYLFVTASDRDDDGTPRRTLDYCLASVTDGGVTKFVDRIDGALPDEPLTDYKTLLTRTLRLRTRAGQFREISEDLNYCKTVIFTAPNAKRKKAWWVSVDVVPPNDNRTGLGWYVGHPPEINDGTWSRGDRTVIAYSIGEENPADPTKMLYRYDYGRIEAVDGTFVAKLNSSQTVANQSATVFATATQTLPNDGVARPYAAAFWTAWNDSEMRIDSGYKMILSAAGKAIAALVQEYERGTDAQNVQWIDLTAPVPTVVSRNTIDERGTINQYRERNEVKKTAFAFWPSITETNPVTPTRAQIEAASGRNGTRHIALGAAGSGFLRRNRSYQFTYAIYDYTTNYETNVGDPALVVTGNDDNVCLYVFLAATVNLGAPSSTNAIQNRIPAARQLRLPVFFNWAPANINNDYNLIYENYQELRFYYREEGTFEWLPAGSISATEYGFNPDYPEFALCRAPVAGLPGGQPGGFIDYSPLPQDEWNDVAIFQDRVWWSSDKSVHYSMRNNAIAYPARNSIACPKGSFRGLTVHNFYGQAEQRGRVVIWGSEEYYYIENTGTQQYAPVRVSIDSVGSFPVDGSEYSVFTRGSITAFSSRAAVVAEGILYFWGSQGVFADDGVGVPKKISQVLGIELQELYDHNRTLEIHASYNPVSKEVVWLYRREGSDDTFALVWSHEFAKFLPWKMQKSVDWMLPISIEDGETTGRLSGQRMLAAIRENDVQRAVFFDSKCKSGDIPFGAELLVKLITTIDAINFIYELELAAGFDPAVAALLVTGKSVSLTNANDYTPVLTPSLCVVTQDIVAGVFRVQAPVAMITVSPLALQPREYVQIYIEEVHGVPWTIETNLWAPAGVRFMYTWYSVHKIWKVDLLPMVAGASYNYTLSYRANATDGYQSRTCTFVNNSLGFCQVFSQFVPINLAHYGQAMQLKLSGKAFGYQSALQYLGMEGARSGLSETQIFEG